MSGTPPAAPPEAPATPTTAQRRQWDRFFTVALLVIGAITVISTFGELADLAGTIDETYRLQGIEGRFEARDAAGTVGFVINVIRVAALLWAAALSISRLRAGKLAFWIPLVAGVVGTLALMIGIGSLILGDPAFLAYVEAIGTTGVVPTPTP